MIPILFPADQTGFRANNGLGGLPDATSCIVTEQRNTAGGYWLEMDYPVDGLHFDLLAPERIILAAPAMGQRPQPFRISRITRPINGIVHIEAPHISVELQKLTTYGTRIGTDIGAMGRGFFAKVREIGQNTHFDFASNITVSPQITISHPEPVPMTDVLLGADGSFLDLVGGEYEFDEFDVVLHAQRGVDSGLEIRYGVNMSDLEAETDATELVTACIPFWKGTANEQDVVVIGDMCSASNASAYSYVRCVPLDVSEQFDLEQDQQPTQAQVTAKGQAFINSTSRKLLQTSIRVSYEPTTSGIGERRINLCDTVRVVYPDLNVSSISKVVETKYNVLTERYDELTIGTIRNNIVDTIAGMISGGASYSGGGYGGGGDIAVCAVLYNMPQRLNEAQKAQARQNIGAAEDGTFPTKLSDLTNDMNFVTSAGVSEYAPVKSVNAKTGAVVLKISDLTNDSGYITAAQAPVQSVNEKTGVVVLDAEDVGALPDDTFIPTKTSQLENDAHFVTEIEAGVTSVNGQTGDVLLTTSDISNTSGYITANDVPQEVPTADASANGMVLGVENGRYTFVRMTGGISDVYMGGASIIQSGTTIAVIPNATTSSQGVVQLYDGTDSTSKSLVPTADALRGVAQRVGNLETRSANWLTETQIKELIDSMVQEQIAMYQRRVFALEDNKEDIDITSLSDLTSHDILYGDHWKQIGTNNNYGAVLYNPESKTIGGSSSDLIYLKRGYIIGVSKNSWFVTSDQNWYCSHVFLSYPKMQAVYAYDEENNIRYTAAEIPAEIVEQAKVLAEDFLSQIESLETEI